MAAVYFKKYKPLTCKIAKNAGLLVWFLEGIHNRFKNR